MGYEVDFLSVGEGERSGDAIAIRYGNLHGSRDEQTIVVIDGGTKESGENLVEHIKKYYKTDVVDHVFLTHSDSDHASGLIKVIEELKVGNLIMHLPWDHTSEISNMFKHQNVTASSLENRLTCSLQDADNLYELAQKKGINVAEPFSGLQTNDGVLTVLGPSLEYYESLLPEFRSTPEAKTNIFKETGKFIEEAVNFVREALHIETLDDSGVTTAENNSSAIVLMQIDGKKLLFTGDAGIPALTHAEEYSQSVGIPLDDLGFFHVPHHGSKRNVGKTILNKIKGTTAFVSASKNGHPKHPAKKVTNALMRRGASVHATRGENLVHYNNAPDRGWGTSTPLPFYEIVEE